MQRHSDCLTGLLSSGLVRIQNATHGRRILSSRPRGRPLVGMVVGALLVLASPIGASGETKLLAADPATGRWMGFSVAIDGDVAAIGAPRDMQNGVWAGAVYVFRRVAGAWVQEEKLVVSDAKNLDQLGFWVDVSGDLIAASAPAEMGTHAGAVYVFRHNGSAWIREERLTASDGVLHDALGLQVAALGNTIVATAPFHASSTGAAYVFRFDGSSWDEEGKLQANDATADDFFGGGLALEDDVVVVGAERENGQGAAYVFRRSMGVWQEEQKVIPAIRTDGDEFGHSVEIEGDDLVVGAPFRAGGGSAYAFRRLAGTWTETQLLAPPGGEDGDEFARHVVGGLDGDSMAIGASGDDDLGANAGAVYFFARRGGSWQSAGKHFASDGSAGADFGFTLELAGDELLVGSPHLLTATSGGAAYVLTVVACADGIDNDGDGLVDLSDPGCANGEDLGERDPLLPCDDGADNDADGRIDFDPVTYADPGDESSTPSGSGDPGCISPSWGTESPQCQDGIDNDGDGKMDYDAGLSANGAAHPAGPDSQCVGTPWVIVEALPTCGLGAELALLLPALIWLRRRNRGSTSATASP